MQNRGKLESLNSGVEGSPKRVARGPGLLSAEVDGETVIMSLGEGCYFGLDDIASDIWKRLESGCELSQLVDGLAEDYDAPRDLIEKDIIDLLRGLAKRGLVVLS